MAPTTRYAKAPDGISIAYQVVGEGPRDLVWVPGWVSHLEAAWDKPTMARFFERLASFSRLILLDKRGTGLSDRFPDAERQGRRRTRSLTQRSAVAERADLESWIVTIHT